MKKQVEFEVELPMLPNFIRIGKKEMLPISDFTEKELREIGKQWIEKLIQIAHQRRNQK